MDSMTTITAYFQPGRTYTLYIPVTMSNLYGYFPQKTPITLVDKPPIEFKNGFFVENEEVGDIVKIHSDKVAVDYLHKFSGDNVIWFYAITGERARILVGSVPVHDHSSIITGGPAYGTYASDSEGTV